MFRGPRDDTGICADRGRGPVLAAVLAALLRSLIPLPAWSPYNRADLPADLIAAATVLFLAVPQGLAYATIAVAEQTGQRRSRHRTEIGGEKACGGACGAQQREAGRRRRAG